MAQFSIFSSYSYHIAFHYIRGSHSHSSKHMPFGQYIYRTYIGTALLERLLGCPPSRFDSIRRLKRRSIRRPSSLHKHHPFSCKRCTLCYGILYHKCSVFVIQWRRRWNWFQFRCLPPFLGRLGTYRSRKERSPEPVTISSFPVLKSPIHPFTSTR